jgi:DNA-binding CsgD family transcriptional regulator
VDALARLGRVPEAVAIAEEALTGATPWIRSPIAVTRLRARVALARGDAGAAAELYARHTAGQTAATLPFELARDRLRYAEALDALGHPDAAADQLELAAATFARLRAPSYLTRARNRLAELRAESDAAARDRRSENDPLAQLTSREHEVAVAVASGMTNREVAERLYVSVTTVNFHVRNILAKLGLRSRRELRTLVAAHRRGDHGGAPGDARGR